MNQLQQLFNYNGNQIRTFIKNDEPWFVAKDVCVVLEISDARQAVDRLDEDERCLIPVTDSLGRKQETFTVNEPGLYSLILGSRKPEAKEFKRWITHEVIPSIRKHGGYLTPAKIEEALSDPDTIIKLATALKEAREEKYRLQAKVDSDKPKVLFADAVSTSKSSILVGELAKLLKQNDIDMGQNRLFQWLRDNGYLIRRQGTDYNMPTQKSMEIGLFEIKETSVTHSDGHISVNKTPKVTGKGQIYFINKFKQELVTT